MPFDIHTVEAPDGSAQLYSDRVVVGIQNNVANLSGSAGVAITTAVTFSGLPVDGSGNALYGVHVTPSQGCMASVSSKTKSGFNVVLTPLSGSVSIAAGTFDVVVTA